MIVYMHLGPSSPGLSVVWLHMHFWGRTACWTWGGGGGGGGGGLDINFYSHSNCAFLRKNMFFKIIRPEKKTAKMLTSSEEHAVGEA